MRRVLALTICGFALPGAAYAAGGPVPPQQGGAGASAPGADSTIQALRAGKDTVLAQVARPAGVVGRTRLLRGSWGVPGVAYDGSTTGLSADGRTLVLGEVSWRFPVRRTRLAIVHGRSLRPRANVTLPGYWVVDAISPDGHWLYFLHYKRPTRNLADYEVRAYDLRTRKLVPGAIVDKREPDEQMGGTPITRAVSGDGRWAYTLYGGEDGPFVHALDTARRVAACIDLPMLKDDDLATVRMSLRGAGLQLARQGAAVAEVNTRTFAVREANPLTGWAARVTQAASWASSV
jgi:hypothetical protein